MWRANVDDACMFAWRSTRSESQRHYSEVGVSSERREPNGVARSRLAGCELRGRRVQQEEECRSGRACSARDGARRSGPGRSGDCPAWLCCAWVCMARWVQARCLVWSVCLRLKLTSALLGGRERQTRRYLDDSHEREQYERELGRLSTVSPAPC